MFQNTLEWLAWRADGIGSSDGPALMGKSKYKSKLNLWKEKFHKIIEEQNVEPNFIQAKGHRLEVVCRGIFEFRTGREWKPKLFTHSEFPWIRASMDGWNEELKEGWECKYMGKDLYLALIDTTKSILERIPAVYLDQICHQFLVTGAIAITLSGVNDTIEVDEAGNPVKIFAHLRIPLTDELKTYIQNVYMVELFAFWKSIQDGVEPEPEKVDAVKIENEALGQLVMKYAELDKDEKKYKNLKEKCKELIFKHPARSHTKMEYNGNNIQLVPGGFDTDYKGALEAFFSWIHQLKTAALNFEINQHDVWQSITGFPDKPNMEKYMKARADSFKVTVKKEKKDEKEKANTNGIPGDVSGGTPDALATGNSETNGTKPVSGNDSSNESSNADASVPTVGHIPPNKVNDDQFDFVNPVTKKRPRGWDKKEIKDKISYCIKESKATGIGAANAKIFLDFAEKMESYLDSLPPVAEPVDKAKELADKILSEETVGGITFSKEMA